jgi:hypothetical protein
MELFRFRVIRPVLSQPSTGLDVTTIAPVNPPAVAGRAGAGGRPPAAPGGRRPAAAPAAAAGLIQWLTPLSQKLAASSDLLTPAACVALLPADWLAQVGSAAWGVTGQQLVNTLVTAFQAGPAPVAADVEAACRLLLVYDLVATLAADQPQPAPQKSLQTASDVQAAVSWRHVILPAALFSNGPMALLARRPGITDFYVVRDEWNHYEPAEIAAVVNVLPGESFTGRIRHSQSVDTSTSTTTEVTTTQLTEQQQTTSSSLSESSSKDASLNIGVQGQVQTSGQYGPTHVDTSLGAQLQISLSQSDSHAMTTSAQTVQRSVKSVTQTVTTQQSQRTVTRDSKVDEHQIQNTTARTTVGIYRWLNEIHYVELVKYPNRFILEFEVPEPGAWLRWALENRPTTGWDNPDPSPFRAAGAANDLAVSDITPANYLQLGQQWRVRGLQPPPAASITLSVKLTSDPPSNDTATKTYLLSDDSLSVPAGYSADTWIAQVASWQEQNDAPDANVYVTVGGSGNSLGSMQGPALGHIEQEITGPIPFEPFDVGGLTSGVIPITVLAHTNLQGITVVVNVTCNLTPEGTRQWQQNVYDQLAGAYQTLLNAFHQERDDRNQQAGGIVDLTGPPELNQQRAVNELRRAVVSSLLGQEPPLAADVVVDPNTGEPDTPPQIFPDTDTIQFFEQSLEWSNIVYICYPYYWGRRDQWVTDVNTASADPVFDRFLSAGSARVCVPVRPGFENLMLYYLYTGQIWGGTQPPAPNDPNYLSIAEEIQSLQKGATDGTVVGSSWEIRLPTTMLWAGTDPTTLPVNPNPTIPPPGP